MNQLSCHIRWDLLVLSALALLISGCYSLSHQHAVLPSPPQIPPVNSRTTDTLASFPQELQDYLRIWDNWGDEVPIAKPNPAVTTALPPRQSSLAFPAENYLSTFPKLLQCMARTDLSPAVRSYLEQLALVHQQQAILSDIYHAVNDIQHAKKVALPQLLSATRRLRDFQEKFQKYCPDPSAASVNEELSPWLACWQKRDPLGVLPSLWRIIPAEKTSLPVSANTAARFCALYDERPVAATLPKELKQCRHLWLHQEFETPVVARGRCVFLILPALPRSARLMLNGIILTHPSPGKPAAIPLTPEILGDAPTQYLAIRLPAKAVGKAILPICLAAGPL